MPGCSYGIPLLTQIAQSDNLPIAFILVKSVQSTRLRPKDDRDVTLKFYHGIVVFKPEPHIKGISVNRCWHTDLSPFQPSLTCHGCCCWSCFDQMNVARQVLLAVTRNHVFTFTFRSSIGHTFISVPMHASLACSRCWRSSLRFLRWICICIANGRIGSQT